MCFDTCLPYFYQSKSAWNALFACILILTNLEVWLEGHPRSCTWSRGGKFSTPRGRQLHLIEHFQSMNCRPQRRQRHAMFIIYIYIYICTNYKYTTMYIYIYIHTDIHVLYSLQSNLQFLFCNSFQCVQICFECCDAGFRGCHTL